MSDLIELFETSYFQVGLRMGLIALAVGWVAAALIRRVKLLPVAGVLIAGFTLLALALVEEPVGTEAIGVLAVVLGVGIARATSLPSWMVPLCAVPGALWLAAYSEVTDLGWVRLAMAVIIPVGGWLITDFERRHGGIGLGVVCYTLAALGVFVAVPDTEWARALVAVAVPVTFLAWPRVAARLGTIGAYAAVSIFVIVAAQGGGPRPASIVGSLACLGVLVMEPIALAIRPEVMRFTTWVKRNWAGAVLASLPQFVVVALCSRVAARFTNELPSLIVVAAVYVATIGVAVSAATIQRGD